MASPNEEHKLLAKLGPEPLTDDFFAKRVYEQSRNKKVPVKQFIMNNAVVVGLVIFTLTNHYLKQVSIREKKQVR